MTNPRNIPPQLQHHHTAVTLVLPNLLSILAKGHHHTVREPLNDRHGDPSIQTETLASVPSASAPNISFSGRSRTIL
jgi:hypothetical protein